jgi:hypothetical protein
MKKQLKYSIFFSINLSLSSLFSQSNSNIIFFENQWRLTIEDSSFFNLDTLVFYKDYYQKNVNRTNTVIRVEKFFPSNWGSKVYNFQRVIVFFVKNNYIEYENFFNLPI